MSISFCRLFWRGNSDTSFHIIDTEVTTHMLENLSPNSQYIIYVIAISKNGQSASSETLIAWTDPAFPAYVDVSKYKHNLSELSFE